MITQMKKYTFLVFHRDYEPFLQQLRDLGVVHITQKAAGLMEDEENLSKSSQKIVKSKREAEARAAEENKGKEVQA